MAASRREILKLLDTLHPKVRVAFLDAIDKITSKAKINELVIALERGDIEAAMQAAGFRQGANLYTIGGAASMAALFESIRNAYIEGGTFAMAANVPKRFGMDFDWTNPRAEEWIRKESSTLITRVIEEQKESIRVVLEAGLNAGRNPRSVALDIVGRVSKQTGKRTGGIVGLNGPQTDALMRARVELETLNSNYFNRKLRDKRFDSIVRKAIENDKPLSQDDANRLTGRYSDRLLKLRSDTIARTETLSAMNAAHSEAMQQVIDEGLAKPENITNVWNSAGE